MPELNAEGLPPIEFDRDSKPLPPHRSESVDELRSTILRLTSANRELTAKVSARDEFMAVAAHELRNPMTPILGRLQLLRRAIAKPDFNKASIEAGLDQIETLVSQYVKRATTILETSRMNSGALRLSSGPVDLGKLVHQVVADFRPVADHCGSEFHLDLPDSGLIAIADTLAVEQILDNLIANAIKYAPGVAIAISASPDEQPGLVRLSIEDSGPGLSAEDQLRIFERFERVVRPNETGGGFGVGLWIVGQLCKAMNGNVDVISVQGRGTLFNVRLPAAIAGDRP